MAVMSETDRRQSWAHLMRGIIGNIPNVSKVALRAAVDAADDWADSNATSYNNALPAAFRNNASSSQKAILLAIICLRRAGILTVDGD